MAKTRSKRKNRTSFNINEINISRPSFPPTITIDDLIKNAFKRNDKPRAVPNAFIAYRNALVKEYRINNCQCPPMRDVSKIAKTSWNMESKDVKDYYGLLVKEAKSVYKRNCVAFVMDKHVKETNQQTYDADQVLPVEFTTENSSNPIQYFSDSHYNNVNFTNSSLIDSSYNFEMNSTLSVNEYTRILEQEYIRMSTILNCLLFF